MKMNQYIDWVTEQHDVVCNQKYDKVMPYSYHLKMVVNEVRRFQDVIDDPDGIFLALHGAWGHDLIEDARVTYNDILQLNDKIKSTLRFPKWIAQCDSDIKFWEELADVIFCLTDDKGRNRDERHSERYFDELKKNKIAVFVKICDIIANVKYSKFSESSMFNKYQKEYPKIKKELYINEYKEIFDYLETTLEL
jgi:hypothetical protein